MAMNKETQTLAGQAKHGYYMYQDGISRWGVGVMKCEESPIRISILDDKKKEDEAAILTMHANKNIDEKIKWHADQVAKAKAEADAKAKKKAIA